MKEDNMNIGKFQQKDGVYTGTVQTFTGSSVAVRIAPTDLKGIDYLVTLAGGETELGAAWNKVGEEKGTKYISVKLDWPFLAAPVYCSLFTQKDGSHNLVWTRPDPRKQKKNQTDDDQAEQASA
jgi:uncharacterized protein (DUF736 family)